MKWGLSILLGMLSIVFSNAQSKQDSTASDLEITFVPDIDGLLYRNIDEKDLNDYLQEYGFSNDLILYSDSLAASYDDMPVVFPKAFGRMPVSPPGTTGHNHLLIDKPKPDTKSNTNQ